MMTMHPRNCFCNLDTVPFSTQFIFLKERKLRKPTMDSYAKNISNRKRAVILSINIVMDTAQTGFSVTTFFFLHLKWEPFEYGLLCCKLAPAAQARVSTKIRELLGTIIYPYVRAKPVYVHAHGRAQMNMNI